MKLLIGLGNPGEKYETTRHNIGFMALDQFLKDFESTKNTVWQSSDTFKSDIAEIIWQHKKETSGKVPHGGEKVILVKPKTYMNDSGLAVSLVKNFYKVEPEDIWVLHDDVDFPIGSMKIRFGGASAGHRGIMSIIEKLGTDKFYRFRLGIGRPGESEHSGVSHYVLDSFSHEDHGKVRELLKRTSKALQVGLEKGLEKAMNQYNTK
ncbi:MAG TPA: aminoacyl-tRNA hydrolase [Patescibacteria group bacterium]|nr:aminoacyl-tRNA hydrolase [Patescibacteria group bacterium]